VFYENFLLLKIKVDHFFLQCNTAAYFKYVEDMLIVKNENHGDIK
jgi:hypothetical protein